MICSPLNAADYLFLKIFLVSSILSYSLEISHLCLTVFVFKQTKTDQPVGPRNLFRTFIIHCLEGIIAIYILHTSFRDLAQEVTDNFCHMQIAFANSLDSDQA